MPQSFVLFVILLGVLITVHELGHFLIAKLLNVKVLRFSIGFGPKIVGFTRGETEYRIAWIPLGGYVKMAGELPHDEVNPEDASRSFMAQPPWKRALIVIGGPLFNLVFPILIYFFVFFGSQEALSTRIRHVEPGLPAATAGIRPGDKVTAVQGVPVATFDQLTGALDERVGRPTTVTLERDGRTIEVTLTPAQMFETVDLGADVKGRVGISPYAPVPIIGVDPRSPAYAAGLRTGDTILSVNGRPVKDVMELDEALRGAEGTVTLQVSRSESLDLPGLPLLANPKLLTLEVPRQEGSGLAALGVESSDLYLRHVYEGGPAYKAGLRAGDKLLAVDGVPLTSFGSFRAALAKKKDQPFEVTWRSSDGETKTAKLQVAQFNRTEGGHTIPSTGVGIVALQTSTSAEVETVTVHFGVGEALSRAVARLWNDIRMTGLVLGKLFTRELGLETVGGPLMMFQLASKATELGVNYYLGLMGLISVNLGIMNLLPIPILDGFGLLSALWEGIRRRPIPMRAREVANFVGLIMLLALMVVVFKNDVMRIWG